MRVTLGVWRRTVFILSGPPAVTNHADTQSSARCLNHGLGTPSILPPQPDATDASGVEGLDSFFECADSVLHRMIVCDTERRESKLAQRGRIFWISAHLIRAPSGATSSSASEKTLQIPEDDIAALKKSCDVRESRFRVPRIAAMKAESDANGGIS